MERVGLSTAHRPNGPALGTVLCVHSVFQDREGSWPIAQAMARAGFEARNLELPPGRSFEDYVRLVEAEVERSPAPVYLWGHSMGADLVAAAHSPKIKARVCAGFPCPAKDGLGLVGVWDQLHSISEFDPPIKVLPFADHDGENFDILGFRATATHFAGRDPGWADPFWGRALLAFGIIVLVPHLLQHTSKSRSRGAAFVLGPAVALWFLDPLRTASRALVVGWVLASESGRSLRRRQIVAIVLALGFATGLSAWQNWIGRPTLLLALPIGLAFMILQLWMKVSSVLSPLVILVVTGVEALWPGQILSLLTYLPRTLWTAAPRLSLRWGKISATQAALLVFLLTAGALAWKQVLDAGYAPEPGQWIGLITRLACLILAPPLAYLTLARRWA